MGTLWPQNLENAIVLVTVISSHRIKCNASIEIALKGFISSYTDNLLIIDEDIMTQTIKKCMNLWSWVSTLQDPKMA